MLYLLALCNGIAQSNLDPPLFGSPRWHSWLPLPAECQKQLPMGALEWACSQAQLFASNQTHSSTWSCPSFPDHRFWWSQWLPLYSAKPMGAGRQENSCCRVHSTGPRLGTGEYLGGGGRGSCTSKVFICIKVHRVVKVRKNSYLYNHFKIPLGEQ